MTVLYLTEPRCTLRRSAATIIVTRDRGSPAPPPPREVLLRLPPHQLEQVALVGDVHVTADALHFCLDQGIGLAWFSRGGRLRGRLVPPIARPVELRLAQYAAWHEPAGRLARARAFVAGKLRNAAAVLEDHFSNYAAADAAGAVPVLRELAGRAAAAKERDTLLGLEGSGAARYFEALAGAFRGDLVFTGRRQHPPPDPANALLSFGYVLLGNRLAGLLEARGLDPALGFLHDPRGSRPALALDLLEEFRHPVVDRFVLRVGNLRILRPEMFEADPERPGGVRLGRDGLQRFFVEWESFLERPLRDTDEAEARPVAELLQRQIERLAADLRGSTPYRPLCYRS